MNILKYSNGFGHLLMSIICLICGVALVLFENGNATIQAIGIGLITTVSGYWFVTSSANAIAQNILQNQQNNTVNNGNTSTQNSATNQ